MICSFCYHSSSGCSVKEAVLDKKWLVNILNGTRILSYGSCQSIKAYRSSGELIDHGQEQISVSVIKAHLVDIHKVKSCYCYVLCDLAIKPNLGKVSYSLEHSVSKTRSSTAPSGHLDSTGVIYLDIKNSCGL